MAQQQLPVVLVLLNHEPPYDALWGSHDARRAAVRKVLKRPEEGHVHVITYMTPWSFRDALTRASIQQPDVVEIAPGAPDSWPNTLVFPDRDGVHGLTVPIIQASYDEASKTWSYVQVEVKRTITVTKRPIVAAASA